MPYLSCWDANPSFPTFFFSCFSSIKNFAIYSGGDLESRIKAGRFGAKTA